MNKTHKNHQDIILQGRTKKAKIILKFFGDQITLSKQDLENIKKQEGKSHIPELPQFILSL